MKYVVSTILSLMILCIHLRLPPMPHTRTGVWIEDAWLPMPPPFNRLLQAGATTAGDEFVLLNFETCNPLSPQARVVG